MTKQDRATLYSGPTVEDSETTQRQRILATMQVSRRLGRGLGFVTALHALGISWSEVAPVVVEMWRRLDEEENANA